MLNSPGTILVAVSLAVAGCTSENASSTSSTDEPIQDEIDAVVLMDGEWIVESVDSVDPSLGGRQLLLRVTAGNAGSSLTLGFEGCSRYGGPAESLSPVALTSTTVAGVPDCGTEDGIASVLLGRLNGAEFQTLDSGEAKLEASGLQVLLSKK